MRRIFALMIALTMSVLSYSYDFSDNNIFYTITSETTVEVSGYYSTASYGPITIPATVANGDVEYTVIGIGDNAFADRTNISDAILPETITYIGEKAFYRCNSMHTVNLPNSIERIGGHAFGGCTNLYSPIVIPPLVTRIEDETFLLCYKIPSIEIHDGVTYIGVQAFGDCKAIKEVYIPNSVTEIDRLVFFGCEALTYIHLPESLREIPYGFVQSCDMLAHIILPKSIETIGENAFRGCKKLEEIVLPENVSLIKPYAFAYSDKLERIILLSSNPPALEHPALSGIGVKTKFYVKESVVEIYKNANNGVYTTSWKNIKNKIDYKIPYSSSLKYSTYYREEFVSDFHMAVEDNTKPFVATSFTESSAILNSLDDGIVPIGTGVVLRNGKPGEEFWYQVAEDQTPTYTGINYLKGFCGEGELEPITEDGSVNFVLYDGKFCTFDNTGMLGIHKAYLQLPTSAGSKQITMSFAGEPSVINDVEAGEQQKVYYNLNGMRVEKPKKGVYVLNGKKIIFK